ncbi:hypothetical protein GCM10010168_56000 [Actinoplanes ianthinogenes]|uniref:Lipoprotein n=1 Tax=Actinoplanes ianthinogenes TaxID=122358 RepID=A0ABM7LQ65_9ACTN|nr:hypothetical protein [Actinoplanes ianthinogenes]BCJ41401.1 hypothetical protein Aiant_20580 [Actinoplanes ianthinogenes]GGR30391.1 hypothetical protein GCM10010168_56000 [Actinoplanes ianthinogenes]
MSNRSGTAVALLLALLVVIGGCQLRDWALGDERWLTARMSDGRLTLDIGGQCGADSYLSYLRIAGDTGVLWEIRAADPVRATPTVVVGVVPPDFTEQTPPGALSGTLFVRLRTNFDYAADVDLAEVADDGPLTFEPQPIWNETSPVRAERC